MDRRITNGLAWAGLVTVLVVPSADFFAQHFGGGTQTASVVTPQTATEDSAGAAEQVADITPQAEPVASNPANATQTADVQPVEPKPRKVPSYISDAQPDETIDDIATSTGTNVPEASVPAAQTAAASAPAVTTPPAAPAQVAATEPKVVIEAPKAREPAVVSAPVQEVASAPAQLVAPVPMPASMRPKVASVQPSQIQTVQPSQAQVPQPPQVIRPVNDAGYASNDDIVTADQLADWESGPLSDYLASIRNGQGQSGQNWRTEPADAYDADGFFLSDGPNYGRRVYVYPLTN